MACRHESTTSLAKIRSLMDLATVGLSADERVRLTKLVVEQGFGAPTLPVIWA